MMDVGAGEGATSSIVAAKVSAPTLQPGPAAASAMAIATASTCAFEMDTVLANATVFSSPAGHKGDQHAIYTQMMVAKR